MKIRRMEPRDIPAGIRIADQENWRYGEADFLRFISMEPKGCFVVVEENVLAGMAFAFSYGAKGSIGGLIVDRDFRKMGFGSALLDRSIEYLDGKVDMIELCAYEHLAEYYVDHGFDVGETILRYGGFPENKIELEMKVRSLKEKDMAWVREYDSPRFGGDRTLLLSRLMAENPLWSVRTKEGYAMAKGSPGDSIDIGPMVSDGPRTWDALFSRLPGSFVELSIPEDNDSAVEKAESLGLKIMFKNVRMGLGEIGELHPSIWALGGVEKG
ncbi:MAG: GNAT family N-acetyltransferase [Candidatus Thermoplasmatota archaeon]|nr:GNAT family N-acetyltransferase [Candidatus Thermoplasmatota archaeon]